MGAREAKEALQEPGMHVSAVRLLQGLVVACKVKGLVRALADAMDVRPQAVYAWLTTTRLDRSPVLTERAARLRLAAISQLSAPELLVIAQQAAEGVRALDVEQARLRSAAGSEAV